MRVLSPQVLFSNVNSAGLNSAGLNSALCGLELCGLSSYVGMAGNPSRTVIPTYETNPKFCEETPSYILHCKSRDVIGRKCLASRASQALMRA